MIISLLTLGLCFNPVSAVKVIKFNRRRPLPDAEDSDFLNTYLNNGVSSSMSVTGYRLACVYSLMFLTLSFPTSSESESTFMNETVVCDHSNESY